VEVAEAHQREPTSEVEHTIAVLAQALQQELGQRVAVEQQRREWLL
jgi:hypothetical protein